MSRGTRLIAPDITPYWLTGSAAAPAELVATIPIVVDPHDPDKRVVLSLDLETSLGPNETILAVAQVEATNTQGYAAEFCTSLILAATPTSVVGVPVGAVLTPGAGGNVTNPGQLLAPPALAPHPVAGQGTHHITYHPAGGFQADPDPVAGLQFVNLVCWAGSTAALPGNALTIMQGYGSMFVLRFTPVDDDPPPALA